jgi:hypothetical protein
MKTDKTSLLPSSRVFNWGSRADGNRCDPAGEPVHESLLLDLGFASKRINRLSTDKTSLLPRRGARSLSSIHLAIPLLTRVCKVALDDWAVLKTETDKTSLSLSSRVFQLKGSRANRSVKPPRVCFESR